METLTRVAVALMACNVPCAIMFRGWHASCPFRRRQRLAYLSRLKQTRSNATRASSSRTGSSSAECASVAVAAYEELQRRRGVPAVLLPPDDPLERVCGVVVHEELDDLLHAIGYQALEDSEREELDWDALGLPPHSEPDAPIASLARLIDALEERRRSAPDQPASPAAPSTQR